MYGGRGRGGADENETWLWPTEQHKPARRVLLCGRVWHHLRPVMLPHSGAYRDGGCTTLAGVGGCQLLARANGYCNRRLDGLWNVKTWSKHTQKSHVNGVPTGIPKKSVRKATGRPKCVGALREIRTHADTKKTCSSHDTAVASPHHQQRSRTCCFALCSTQTTIHRYNTKTKGTATQPPTAQAWAR